MNLVDYVNKQVEERGISKAKVIRELGDKIGVNDMSINCWLWGRKPIGPQSALKIHKFTNGEVSLHEMRPDWWSSDNKDGV